MIRKIELRKGIDAHVHLRDGDVLSDILSHSCRDMQAAVVMPNLVPPIVSIDQAEAYRERILAALPRPLTFTPWMTLYLTDQTTPKDVEKVARHPHIIGFKLYPSGVTTHSNQGIKALHSLNVVLEAMQYHDVPLMIHGEDNDPTLDIFDRERIFIERYAQRWVQDFPNLRCSLEHITTSDAVDFVKEQKGPVVASITAHHLLMNRNHLFLGGLRPHMYCLPILKRDTHQKALIQAALSGTSKFFAGTDSAPHAQHHKESSCGCAGIFTAHAALPLYAEVFDAYHQLDRLEDFVSTFSAQFYRIPMKDEKITLVSENWLVPESYPLGKDQLIPMRANEHVAWRVAL
jgi:dihydroorotase